MVATAELDSPADLLINIVDLADRLMSGAAGGTSAVTPYGELVARQLWEAGLAILRSHGATAGDARAYAWLATQCLREFGAKASSGNCDWDLYRYALSLQEKALECLVALSDRETANRLSN